MEDLRHWETLRPFPKTLFALDEAAKNVLEDSDFIQSPELEKSLELHTRWVKPAPEFWVEASLDKEWLVAYRLVPDAAGTPIVAEIRIFPKEEKRAGFGRWSGEWRGTKAKVPKGGIKARLLRFRIGEHLRLTEAFYRSKVYSSWVRTKAGFRPPSELPPTPRVLRKNSPSILTLAKLAEDYSKVIHKKRSSGHLRPIVEIAAKRRLSVKRVRALIFQAREQGLLTRRSEGQGIAAGDLTEKAEAVLKSNQPGGKHK